MATTDIWNIGGHAAGVVLFVAFLLLVVRRPSFRGADEALPLAVVGLALVWNLASIGVIALGRSNGPGQVLLAGVAFAALSALPAGLFRLCVGGRLRRLVWAGYGLSAAAVALHLGEVAVNATAMHVLGLAVVTVGFGLLTAVAVLTHLRGSQDRISTARAVSTMSLFLFAMSFAHFSEGHIDEAWSSELLIHHAGIPLALWVLLQDYRFVFADALILLVTNGLLAVVFGWGAVAAGQGRAGVVQVALAASAFALFGFARERMARVLTRLLFRQPDRQRVAASLSKLRGEWVGEERYLALAGREMGELMDAPFRGIAAVGQDAHAAAVVPVRVTALETKYVLLGERQGGRPYLSADYEVLSQLGAVVSEQMERVRALEVERLAATAELRALQAQINPHFLFNALNTLYGTIPREAALARKNALSLAELFRYFLRTERTFVPLREELEIVRSYLSIEEQRLGGKLAFVVDAGVELLAERIPTLSIQPLVENAVKHGVAANPEGGTIRVSVAAEGGQMVVSVSDTGFGSGVRVKRDGDGAGIGLENVRRRLELCYGSGAGLDVQVSAAGSTACFAVPLAREALRMA